MKRRFFGVCAPIAAVLTSRQLTGGESGGGGGGAVNDAGSVVWHYVGRVSLNFATGSGTVVAYLTHLNGVGTGAELFAGTPGVATAMFTVYAEIQFQALEPNGDPGLPSTVLPIYVKPGDFAIHYNAGGGANWSTPASFARGQAVATLARNGEQFSIVGPVGVNVATGDLQSTSPFVFQGRTFQLRRVIGGGGVTNVTTGTAAPLPGSTQTSQSFALAGYGLVAR